jgi:hypothetical protein
LRIVYLLNIVSGSTQSDIDNEKYTIVEDLYEIDVGQEKLVFAEDIKANEVNNKINLNKIVYKYNIDK